MGSSVKGKALKGWWSCGVAEASLVAGPSSEWTSQGTDIGKGAVGPRPRPGQAQRSSEAVSFGGQASRLEGSPQGSRKEQGHLLSIWHLARHLKALFP